MEQTFLLYLFIYSKVPCITGLSDCDLYAAGVKNTCLGWGLQSLPGGWGASNLFSALRRPEESHSGYPQPCIGCWWIHTAPWVSTPFV